MRQHRGDGMSATVPGTSGSASEGSAVALDGALQGFRDMLAADGYELNWSVTGQDAVTGEGKVRVQIVAGPDACADCLVPLPVIEGIMTDALAPTPYALDSVVLPAGE
jgi:hypothetical protein